MKTPTDVTHFVNISRANGLRGHAGAGHLLTSNLPRRMACLLFTLGVGLLARPCAATPGQWEYTGSLNTARSGHTATLLSDGRVLVAAGEGGPEYLRSAELYDPATGNWSVTGSLHFTRDLHTATLLPNGRVLVAAGVSGFFAQTTAELYDPATATWAITDSLHTQRYLHSATLLPDGRVVVVGGFDDNEAIPNAELYNPAPGTWTETGSLGTGRFAHTATLLPDGKVLVAGGGGNQATLASAELYDPTTDTWTPTGNLNTDREFHSATLLSDGKVLVVGGYRLPSNVALTSAELYDPATGTWTLTGSLQLYGRLKHTATLLPDGRVLVAAGQTTLQNFGDGGAELYDPTTGTWTITDNLNTPRTLHTATLLLDGQVLVAGGRDTSDESSAELYDPGITAATQVSGRGAIDGQGDAATFNFRAKQSGDRPTGSFSFSDPAAGILITKAKVRTLTFNGNSANFSGTARLGNGTRVTYSVTVTDNSSDGSSDTFSITLSNGYSASGILTSGDIQIQ
jgi:Galactose oxidase, central domain